MGTTWPPVTGGPCYQLKTTREGERLRARAGSDGLEHISEPRHTGVIPSVKRGMTVRLSSAADGGLLLRPVALALDADHAHELLLIVAGAQDLVERDGFAHVQVVQSVVHRLHPVLLPGLHHRID